MTESGMTESTTSEINFYVQKIIKSKKSWMKEDEIENIYIKPHPRQCNNQACNLLSVLKI